MIRILIAIINLKNVISTYLSSKHNIYNTQNEKYYHDVIF